MGISTGSWHYRRYGDPRRVLDPIPQADRRQPQQLDDQEVSTITALLHEGWDAGLATHTICRLATDRGEHIASPRTFDRIAARIRSQNTSTPPRRRKPDVAVAPIVVADRPDAAWSWDITDLPGLYVGIRYKAYVVTDIYSRKIVAYRVEQRESKDLAEEMLAAAFDRSTPGVVHADSGAAMIAGNVKELLARRGVIESHSRPRVSNDNPYSEAAFATMKTRKNYPGVFADLDHARRWVDEWVAGYNGEHLHSGVGFYAPDEVYDGTWARRHRRRQCSLDEHYARFPHRYRRPPVASQPDAVVGINLHKAPAPEPTHRLTTG